MLLNYHYEQDCCGREDKCLSVEQTKNLSNLEEQGYDFFAQEGYCPDRKSALFCKRSTKDI